MKTDAPSLKPAAARIAQLEAELADLRATAEATERSPTLILRLTAGGQRAYTNPSASAFERTLDEATAQALHAHLRAAAAACLAACLAAGHTLRTELSSGGHYFTLSARPAPAGEAATLYLTDITEHYQAEQQITEERNFFQTRAQRAARRRGRVQPRAPLHLPEPGRHQVARNPGLDCGQGRLRVLRLPRLQPRPGQGAARVLSEGPELAQWAAWEETLNLPEGTRHFLRRFLPIYRPDGTLHFMLDYGLDITDRRQTEERLRESDEMLREQQAFQQLVLDVIPAAVYVRDQGRTTFANRAMQELNVLANRQSDRIHPDSQEAREMAHYAQVDAQVIATGQAVRSEDSLTLASGEVRWFQTVKCPFPRPDGTVLVLGASTDITVSKEARLRVERSEKRYRDLQHYALALIYTHTPDGQLLTVNPACAQLMGVAAETLAAGHLTQALHPRLQPRVDKYLRTIGLG